MHERQLFRINENAIFYTTTERNVVENNIEKCATMKLTIKLRMNEIFRIYMHISVHKSPPILKSMIF